MVDARDYMLRVRMTEAERRMLEALVEATGLSASDIARQGIRQQYEARFGDCPPAKKRKR